MSDTGETTVIEDEATAYRRIRWAADRVKELRYVMPGWSITLDIYPAGIMIGFRKTRDGKHCGYDQLVPWVDIEMRGHNVFLIDLERAANEAKATAKANGLSEF